MSAEIESAFDDLEIKLTPDGGGIFEVAVNGRLIYSKFRTDRFPEPGEISALL